MGRNLYFRAIDREKAGYIQSAFSLCLEASRIDPRIPEVWEKMTEIAGKEGMLRAALICAKRALALEPGSAKFNLLVGALLYRHGRHDEARTHIEKALSLDGSLGPAWNILANICREAGRFEEALDTSKNP